MKKTSIICIILAALMIVPFMASCGKQEIYSNVSIVFQEPAGEPDENGNVTMKNALELGLTIDERIADGVYFAKSIKLLRKLLQNPELLELPLQTEIEFE